MKSVIEKRKALARPALSSSAELSARVSEILKSVREGGDAKLRDLTLELDRANVKEIEVPASEIESAKAQIPAALLQAMEAAIENITRFHAPQIPKGYSVETRPGVRCEKNWLPLERVGLYIPGGTAPLISTVLMLGIPARLAGCNERILVTPPMPDGSVNPAILAAAKLAGITRVFRAGGAQAIAALAYGTESIPKVDKIFGPGNAWVTEAKMQVSRDSNGAAIDLPAGPSEVLVIADESANPFFVASDLLSQAEHGSDSQCVLISTSKEFLDLAAAETFRQMETLPRREIASKALASSIWIETATMEEAIEASNLYAPEHLILQVRDPRKWLPSVHAAGSVFLGAFSPETAGDYASGTNHVLPTYGYARAYGGVGVESFLKPMTVQELSEKGLRDLSPTLLALALAEGLEAHARAVEVRLGERR